MDIRKTLIWTLTGAATVGALSGLTDRADDLPGYAPQAAHVSAYSNPASGSVSSMWLDQSGWLVFTATVSEATFRAAIEAWAVPSIFPGRTPGAIPPTAVSSLQATGPV